MNFASALVVISCALIETYGYPAYYPYYGANMDSLSYGSPDNTRGAMVMNRYYQPYYPTAGGMAAFMVQQPNRQSPPSEGYYSDRRRQTQPQETNYVPPQQNEVFYPQVPEDNFTTKLPEIADPTERTEIISTTVKAIVPELIEPEVEEVEEQKPRKVSRKKQVKRPIEEEDEDETAPRMPNGAFFPMFFGWGGRSGQSGGAPGVMAVANAYSTGRGGVSSSHATAYGAPRPDDVKL